MNLNRDDSQNVSFNPLRTTEGDHLLSDDSMISAPLAAQRPHIDIKSFDQLYMRKNLWPETTTPTSENHTLQSSLSAASMNKRIDAMYKMYVSEKEKHQATKQVLDKAIDLASQLMSEI